MTARLQGVIKERIEAQNKITALEKFIHGPTFHSVDVAEQDRIKLQLKVTQQLEQVLSDRISYSLEAA